MTGTAFTSRLCPSKNGSPKYTEYRVSESPVELANHVGMPGDVCLAIADMNVWYFNDTWEPWLGLSRTHVHPAYPNRFLVPHNDMFLWTHVGMYVDAKLNFKSTFGTANSPKDVVARYLSDTLNEKVVHGEPIAEDDIEIASSKNMDVILVGAKT